MAPQTMREAPPFPAAEIWQRLDPTVPFKGDWIDFRHEQQTEFLQGLARYAPFDVGLSYIDTSEEGRLLHTLRFGRGPRRVMIWARQHGNEPDCTAGLCMALYELVLRSEDPVSQLILSNLELGILPMVNPDGVARFTRQNALGIDINRDAVALATREGRALVSIKDSLKPEVCFNLHDMGPRKSTEGGNLVALAFQAGPFEPRDIDNPVRLRAKHLIGLMNETVAEVQPACTAKYTADYMHRAFGDSMMRWGVSSILIEAGGWFPERGGDDFVRRLFALALLRGLHAIATAEDATPSGTAYDTIPFDSGRLFYDLLLEGGEILDGQGHNPFRAAIAVNVNVKADLPQEPIRIVSTIENVGDLDDSLAKKKLRLEDKVLLPGFLAVAPSLSFEDAVPTAAEALPFLRAGITTVACGFGPFASNRARERWMQRVQDVPPPLNVIAFERVATLREIRERHGMSELAGLLVQDLAISPEDLLGFANLFYPATVPDIDGTHWRRPIGLDVFFQASASPSGGLIHLHLSHLREFKSQSPIRQEELRAFVDDLLRSASQISLSMDAADESFDWLPVVVGFGGLSHGRLPKPNFLGNILRNSNARGAESVVAALESLSLQNARAFRMATSGAIQLGSRADILGFEKTILQGGEESFHAQPSLVISNGSVVIDRAAGTEAPAAGAWSFAAASARGGK